MGCWKGVRVPALTGEIELYDLCTDVGEERDVAAEHPDVARRIAGTMALAHEPSSLRDFER